MIPTALLNASSAAQQKAVLSNNEPLIEEVKSKGGSTGKGPNTSSTSTARASSTASASTEKKTATGAQAPPKSILKNAKQPGPASTSTLKPALPETTTDQSKKTSLIEELPDASALTSADGNAALIDLSVADFLPVPKWGWAKDGERIRIDVEVPKLVSCFVVSRSLKPNIFQFSLCRV